MNGEEIKKLLASSSRDEILDTLARIMFRRMIDEGWFRSCLNCRHWGAGNEICALVGRRPPATVIVSGCEQHSDTDPDEIPF